MTEPMFTDAEREEMLAELGVSAEVAAAPQPLVSAVTTSGEVVPPEESAAAWDKVATLTTGAIVPVSDLPINTMLFQKMSLNTPAECEAAYRLVFDKYKVHRRISPGYNSDLTKRIRKTIKAAIDERKPEGTGFVKREIKDGSKRKIEHALRAQGLPEEAIAAALAAL